MNNKISKNSISSRLLQDNWDTLEALIKMREEIKWNENNHKEIDSVHAGIDATLERYKNALGYKLAFDGQYYILSKGDKSITFRKSYNGFIKKNSTETINNELIIFKVLKQLKVSSQKMYKDLCGIIELEYDFILA